MMDIDEFLVGAIDMHVHGYPDIGLRSRGPIEDVDIVTLARARGMRGIVLKSHFWPTMDRVYQLYDRLAIDDATFTVFSSITLNPIAGGLSPMSVDAAAGHGAKVVFLPTWGSEHDDHERGFVRRAAIDPDFPSFAGYLKTSAIRVLDDRGAAVPAINEIIEICKARNLVLCTAHIGADESLAVARAAKNAGFTRLVHSHPCSPAIRASIDDMVAAADLGALVEFTPVGPVNVSEAYAAIRAIGPGRCILTTDAANAYHPEQVPEAEYYGNYVRALMELGITPAEIRTMIVDNPCRYLGIAT
jgi:hypothetical protein